MYDVIVRVFWDNIHSNVFHETVSSRTRLALSEISGKYWNQTYPGMIKRLEVSFSDPADAKVMLANLKESNRG